MNRKTLTIGAIVLGVALLALLILRPHNQENEITATATSTDLEEVVSLSGYVEAESSVSLSFPKGGVVSGVAVEEGQMVAAGTLLATLNQAAGQADIEAALANVSSSEAALAIGNRGARAEAKAVSEEQVRGARVALAKTVSESELAVANARRSLLSGGLGAYTNDPSEPAESPIITGTYTSDIEGEYIVRPYRSSTLSGYSFTLSGLEQGTFPVSANQPTPLGTRGLYISFPDTALAYSEWHVPIPNPRSSVYAANKNAYDAALRARENAIASSEAALSLTLSQTTLSDAPSASEEYSQLQAALRAARANAAAAYARASDNQLTAPYSGTVARVSITPGETVLGGSEAIVLLSDQGMKVTLKIPEIDVAQISSGSKARLTFDAFPHHEPIAGTIGWIEPIETVIDGVTYYQADVYLDETMPELRAGMSATVDIITASSPNVLTIPERFVIRENGESFVLIKRGNRSEKISVKTGRSGSNSLIEITDGLSAGEVVVLPPITE